MNIETLKWDQKLCDVFGIPMNILPEIRSSSEIYACLFMEGILDGVPISGVSKTIPINLFNIFFKVKLLNKPI